MSNLRPQVRTAIQNFLGSQEDNHTPTDILRVICEEATLMKETEDVRDALTSDPYEHFDQIPQKTLDRFKRSLQVTVCDRVRCGPDYARIHAIVSFPTSNNMDLTFLYERHPRRGIPPGENGECPSQVSYTIELSFNHGQRERLLEVQVWAASNVPSTEPAVCIQNEFDNSDNDEEDGWEDIDDNDDDGHGDNGGYQSSRNTKASEHGTRNQNNSSPHSMQAKKKQRINTQTEDAHETDQENDNDIDNRDQYVAFLDPDVLQSFLDAAGLLPLEDGTAFFLLMTFPFFEHEWDLVGFVLDQFFGGDSDEEE